MRFDAVYTLVAAAILCAGPACAANAGAPRGAPAALPDLSPADQAFMAAREAVRVGDQSKLAQLAPQLRNHPLAAYVEYWQLLPRLRSPDAAAITIEVEGFLSRHAGTYVADRLRLD